MPPASNFDVIVIGLGGIGSAAVYHLAARKQRVLGIEQYSAAHDRGSSHGDSRIIRQAYHESPDYVPLILRAYELWERLEYDSGVRVLNVTGGLILGRDHGAIVQGAIQSATEHRLAFQILSPAEMNARFPGLRPRIEDVAVFEERAGYLRPEAAVMAHLRLAEGSGAQLHFGEQVADWTASPGGESVSVTTSLGTYTAERLVIAPGPWAAGLLKLDISLSVRRHVMAWFDPGEHWSLFTPERMPIYIWETSDNEVFYGFPAIDGPESGAKIAMHSGGDECSPETIRRQVTPEDLVVLRTQMAKFLPCLNGPLIRAMTCMYTVTQDRHFVVSLHPHFEQVAIAAGFSGHGFKFAPVMGEVLADLALHGKTTHPVSFLSPQRLGPNFRHLPAKSERTPRATS